MAENLTFNLEIDSSKAVSSINTFFDTFEAGADQAKSKLNSAFNQKYQTSVEVQFKNGEVVAKKIQNIKQESNRLATVYKAVNGELGRTPIALKKQLSILKNLRDNTEKYSRATGKVSQDWKTLTSRIGQANQALGKMGQGGSMMGKLKQSMTGFAPLLTLVQTAANLATAAIMGMIRAVAAIGPAMIERAKEVENLKLSLGGFLESEKEVSAVMSSSKAIALTYGASLSEIEKGYKRLTPTILAAGGSLKDTEKVIIAMTARTTQLGLNTEQTSRYMEAIAQVFGKGKLQAEELTKQLSQMDGALRSQLDTYVKNNTEFTSLIEAMEAGAMTADMFKEAFISVSKDAVARLASEMFALQETFNNLTIQQVQNKIETLNTLSLDSLNDTFKGFGESILRIQAAFSQFLASITNNLPGATAQFKALMDGLGVLLELVVNGFLNGIKVILMAIELQIQAVNRLSAAIRRIPGVDPLLKAVGNLGEAFMKQFRKGTDGLNSIGEAAQEDIKLLADIQQKTNESGEGFSSWGATAKIAFDNATEAQKKVLEQLEKQKGKLAELKGQLEADHKEDLGRLKEKISAINEKIREEKTGLREVVSEIKEKFREEKAGLDENLRLVREKYSEEIGILQEMGPYQRELYELEKKKLREEIASNEIGGEAVLRAQARLERMEAQEKIARLRKEQIAEEAPILEQIDVFEKQRTKDIKNATDASDRRTKALESEKSSVEEAVEAAVSAYKKEVKAIEAAEESADELLGIVKVTTGAVETQTGAVYDLRDAYNAAAIAAGRAADAARKQASAESNANNSSSNSGGGSSAPPDVRASGGPVSGGSSYTVNELGKEAFLSASGALSMINAPSFGRWKAPGSGTVIPAHLTKQLNVPSGGVNINKTDAASLSAARGGTNMGRMVKALAGALGGDTVTNNVTIQSANTNKTASHVMVELAKLKRLRYN